MIIILRFLVLACLSCVTFTVFAAVNFQPPANFQLCFNPDPNNQVYWPANLVPQGNANTPYCINQDTTAAGLTTYFETDVFYAVHEALQHIRPAANLATTPTLKISMQFDTSGGNCAAQTAEALSTDLIHDRTYYNPGPLELFTTGQDLAGRNNPNNIYHADILMNCSSQDVANFWLDPNPSIRNSANPAMPTNPADMNKADFVSMQLHELLHGFGIMSERDPSSGEYWYDSPPTKFDTFVIQYNNYYLTQTAGHINDFWNDFLADDNGQAFFIAPHVRAYLKAQTALQLTSLPGIPIASVSTNEQVSTQNFSHIGIIKTILPDEVDNPFDKDCLSYTYRDGVYKIFANDIMTMCYEPTFNITYGIKNNRMNISSLDYAILEDLGYTIDEP